MGQACKSTASPEQLVASLQTFCAFGDPSEAAVEASISASVVGSALPCQEVPWQLAEVASAFASASEAAVTSEPTAAVVAVAFASAFVAAIVAAVEGTAAVAVAALEPAAGRTASSSVSDDGVFSFSSRLFVALVAAVEVEEASASEVAAIAAVVDARTAGR